MCWAPGEGLGRAGARDRHIVLEWKALFSKLLFGEDAVNAEVQLLSSVGMVRCEEWSERPVLSSRRVVE